MTRILVIEDEGPLREEIVGMLGFEGYDVIEASDGQQGVDSAKETLPDLILCDITMPKLDGYQVLLELRDCPTTALTPFIFLTARSDRPFMRHGMELGADDYVTKPCSHAELLAAIQARLQRHAAAVEAHNRRLEEAQATLTRLVAHELRTPLVSILMVQDIIARQMGQTLPAQMQDLLDILASGSKRLAHLVEQMVYITELEAGFLCRTSVLESGQPVQLWEVLTTAIDLGRQFATRHRDGPIRSGERDRGTVIVADTQSFKHALAELFANALNFSPEGSDVLVSLWQADGCAWIEIMDHGPGMTPEQLEQAFTEFHQVNRGIQEQQGIGLGLSLARQIMEAHGGTVTLNSVVGKGTQVTVSLPLADHGPS
jgi:two-component system sensor histidine kinase/response regulator